MAYLIDKSTLVAEIEKLIDEIYAGRPFDSLSSEQQTALWYIKSIMSSVNNLEVKEMDLEKEIQRQYEVHKNPDNNIVKNCVVMTKDGFEYFAKHFFELGARIKKEEKYEIPSVSKTEDVSVTSRMAMIDDNLKPIAEFILDYANWNLHKDEWNHPVLEVPLFRVLDALIQKGKPYCGKN